MKCKRCYHKWKPRKKGKPKVCPKCHDYLWYKEKIKRTICKCKICDNVWSAYSKNPKVCSNCKSKSWNIGYNTKCKICKRLSLIPIIHHINGNHNDNSKRNRIIICYECHAQIHNGISNRTRGSKGRAWKNLVYYPKARKKILRLRKIWLKNVKTNERRLKKE